MAGGGIESPSVARPTLTRSLLCGRNSAANSRRFPHKVRISDDLSGLCLLRSGPHEEGKAIDQSTRTPVDQLLPHTMQPVLLAQSTKQIGSHGRRAMVFQVENPRLLQQLNDGSSAALANWIRIRTKVRMMEETFSADFQFRSQSV